MEQIYKNRALRGLACGFAAKPEHSSPEEIAVHAATAGKFGATKLEITSAVRAGLSARTSPDRYTSRDPIVLWSKGRDFGSCEQWSAITENARR